MAGEVPPLNVEILVQLSNLTAAVQEATAGLNKIGDTAVEQNSKFDSLKSTMLGVFAGNLMTKGVEILTTGLHDAVKAIQDTQVATEQLSTAMNNSKQNTAANRAEVTATTDKMSALGFSVKDSEAAYTKLITATGSTTESTKLMSMAADLARYKHEDLATAAATLEKGTLGNAKAFKEFGITLDTTLPKNQAIAKAMDELNAKIGGQAVGYTHTFAGEMEILKAKFDDVAVKVGAVVMPILTKLMEFITGVLIPAIEFLYNATLGAWIKQLINLWNTHEGLRKVIVGVVEVVVGAFGYLLGAIAKVVDTVAKIPILGAPFKAIGKGVDEAALAVGKFGASLDSLANKKITLPSLGDALKTSGSTGTGGDAGIGGGLGAAGNVNKAAVAAQKALDARNAKIKTLNDQAVALEDQMNTALTDRQNKMAAAQATFDDATAKAQGIHDANVASINQTYQDKITAAQDAFNSTTEAAEKSHQESILNIQKQYADKATQLVDSANAKKQSIIDQSIGLMTSAFESATKIDLGKLFVAGGTSAAGLQDQLKAQLADVTQLQKDAGLLAAQGYNQSFIDEVIAQGPKQGDALAQAVLTATPDTQASIKDLYNQINSTSQDGVTDLAKKMNDGVNFANQQLATQFNQVGVDLKTNLADNAAQLTTALTSENDKFNAAMTAAQDTLDKATAAATNARDIALQKADDTLQASLNAAQDAFTKSTQAISDAAMKQLDALQKKLDDTAAKIQALGASAASISGYEASVLVPAGVTGATTTTSGSTSPTSSGTVPAIGNANFYVSTTDPSLPTVSAGVLAAITLGQTQGISPATAVGTYNKLQTMGAKIL